MPFEGLEKTVEKEKSPLPLAGTIKIIKIVDFPPPQGYPCQMPYASEDPTRFYTIPWNSRGVYRLSTGVDSLYMTYVMYRLSTPVDSLYTPLEFHGIV